MTARDAKAAQSIHDPLERVQQALPAAPEIVDGDLVRCPIAPYLFRARTLGGSLLLEPVGAQRRHLELRPKAAVARSSRPST
jgi:hypothetical protein